MAKQSIGFIGTGIMGKSMAGHVMKAGYPLHVYNRTRSKSDALVAEGASWHDSVESISLTADVIITIVGYPADVEEVYLGNKGILQSAHAGSYVIDMTTSSPALAKRIFAEAKKRNIHALDAPVTGGDVGAREAKLSIMVGGERPAFDAIKPILDCMGTTVVYQGGAGSGQHAKLANQIAIAGTIMAVCESLAYAKRTGLDQQTVLASIENGSAGSRQMTMLAPRMIRGDFAPGFYIKHFVKDMKIALDVAEEMNLDLPGLALAHSLYKKLIEEGASDDGTQALYRHYIH
jgi:3-hydroxyisobutyrate dehydrogenase